MHCLGAYLGSNTARTLKLPPISLRFALLLAVAGPFAAAAEPPVERRDFLVQNWQTEQGLPRNIITAIAQDQQGYLWFGTPYGLVRFDGVRFVAREGDESPDFAKVFPGRFQADSGPRPKAARPSEELEARDELMLNVMKVMADHKLDAIVHKSVEHTPTLIRDGLKPPYPSKKGSITINTFLIYVASVTVPAGFTPEGLPVGITFFGRGYSEPQMLKYAYAYEQGTHHRIPPKTTPELPAK